MNDETAGPQPRGRPRGRTNKADNGRGVAFSRERREKGEVVSVVVLLEQTDYAALQTAAKAEERSTAAHMRWIVRQWLAGRADAAQTPPTS